MTTGKLWTQGQAAGFTDKLYWRQLGDAGTWHCFKRERRERVWTSLCRTWQLNSGSGGQDVRRPPSIQRCPRCDVAEMKRRGWDESGPDTVNASGEKKRGG